MDTNTDTADTEAASDGAPGDLRFVQDFANTIDVETGADDLATPVAAAAWLLGGAKRGAAANVAPPAALEAATHARLLALRSAIRDLLRANHDRQASWEDYEAINTLAATTPLAVRLGPSGFARLEGGGDATNEAVGRLIGAIYDAAGNGTWERLKMCPADGCEWVFYDRSRNRSGTWCSMRVCGNRAKVRRYQRKLRAPDAAR